MNLFGAVPQSSPPCLCRTALETSSCGRTTETGQIQWIPAPPNSLLLNECWVSGRHGVSILLCLIMR